MAGMANDGSSQDSQRGRTRDLTIKTAGRYHYFYDSKILFVRENKDKNKV